MNANDAGQLKNKFDALMKTAEIFGNESRQLSQTRKNLENLANSFQDFSTQIANLVSCCQEYLNTVDSLVSDGFTQQIGQDISKVSDLVGQYQKQSEELTNQYRKSLALFEENLEKVAKQQSIVILAAEKATEANASIIEDAIQQSEIYGAEIKAALQKSIEAQHTAAAEEVARLLDVLSSLANIQSAQISLNDMISQVQIAGKDIDSRLQSGNTQIIATLKDIREDLNKYTVETSNLIQCSLDEKTTYLETQFQASIRNILNVVKVINKKADSLSNISNQIENLILELDCKYTDQINQLVNHNKVMRRYLIAGFGILFVLSVFGFFT